MTYRYLRVKNWSKLQHYSDRRPPWIKVYQGLLGDDDAFAHLDEFVQWQLVRIWIVASRSSQVTVDENGKQVPVVANDATSLQRSIMSLKKPPLAQLIRDGWLIPVAEDEVVQLVKSPRGKPELASTVASSLASADASVPLRSRGLEGLEHLDSEPGRHSEEEGLPIENELLVARLMQAIGDHADRGTRHIVRRHAAKLPPASLAKVTESLGIHGSKIRDRAAYAVGALSDELAERESAA